MRVLLLLLMVSNAVAQVESQNAGSHRVVTDQGLHWFATSISGLQMAVVSGDPEKPGAYVLRLRAQRDVKVPPHWHPTDENLTVLSGRFSMGSGDRFVQSSLRPLRKGDYVFVPKEMRHFGTMAAGTTIQLHGEGPFVTNWVDPSALKSPRKSGVDSVSERSKAKSEQDKR